LSDPENAEILTIDGIAAPFRWLTTDGSKNTTRRDAKIRRKYGHGAFRPRDGMSPRAP
jgi:hypothetical protein